jgi:hypothetical protein
LINQTPPTTRGYLLASFESNKIQFLPWKNIETFLTSDIFSRLSLEKKEELRNQLYEQVIEYDPNTESIWLSIVKSKLGTIDILYAIKNRPLTFEQMANKYGITRNKIETVYRYWEETSTSEHHIGIRLGLSVKTVVELFALFEDTIPPEIGT